jgi:hypothetical protein
MDALSGRLPIGAKTLHNRVIIISGPWADQAGARGALFPAESAFFVERRVKFSNQNFPQKRHSFIARNLNFPQKSHSFIPQNQKFSPLNSHLFIAQNQKLSPEKPLVH